MIFSRVSEFRSRLNLMFKIRFRTWIKDIFLCSPKTLSFSVEWVFHSNLNPCFRVTGNQLVRVTTTAEPLERPRPLSALLESTVPRKALTRLTVQLGLFHRVADWSKRASARRAFQESTAPPQVLHLLPTTVRLVTIALEGWLQPHQ